jgi:hypothetical protein
MAMTVDFIGPFEHHDVVVNGCAVPFLTATPWNGGRIHLTLDGRFGLDLTVAEAEQVVPFIADAIAVALGYTAHPDAVECPDPRPRNPFARMTCLIDSGDRSPS